jgi:hypothetical protein
MNQFAADEMYEGYMDGLSAESPEPSGNRTPAYIHGFLNGRDDRRGCSRAPAVALRIEAAKAIEKTING